MSKVKVLLADKHRNAGSVIRAVLSRLEFVDWVGEALTREELSTLVELHEPSVVLTDIVTPQQSCLDAIELLLIQYPYIKFIILTRELEPEYVLRAVRAGVKGFIFKEVEPKELEHAIRLVHLGGKYFSPEVGAILAEAIMNPEPLPDLEISNRERMVLKMVATGNSSRKIADMLEISIRTVEAHREKLLKRFGVTNTAQLIQKSAHYNII